MNQVQNIIADAPFGTSLSDDDRRWLEENFSLIRSLLSRKILTDFEVTQVYPDAMKVAIAAGSVISGTALTAVSAQQTSAITAPTTYKRIDLISVNKSTGASTVTGGTEAATPSAPATPSNEIALAYVTLWPGMTSIPQLAIQDIRNQKLAS